MCMMVENTYLQFSPDNPLHLTRTEESATLWLLCSFMGRGALKDGNTFMTKSAWCQ